MTDVPRPPDEPDHRDERVAALLEVPRLDDVTRRRLVRRALDESGAPAPLHRRTYRLVAVAAAAAAVLVIGGVTAALLRDGDGDGGTVARRDREAAQEDAEPGAAAERPMFEPPVPIGDLGEVSDPTVLRERVNVQLVAGASGEQQRATEAFARVPEECLAATDEAFASPAEQIATATYDGAPALVLVAWRETGRIALVVDASTCEILADVSLT